MRSGSARLLETVLGMLGNCTLRDEDGDLQLLFHGEPRSDDRAALEAARIVVRLDRVGDILWVTANLDDSTVMLPFAVPDNGSHHRRAVTPCSYGASPAPSPA